MPQRVYSSPYPDVPIPELALHDLLLRQAKRWPRRTALIDGATGVARSYGELVAAVEAVAGHLHEAGFRAGDVAALCAANCPEFVAAFLGVSRLGGATTLLNPAMTGAEMRLQLEDSGANFGFAGSDVGGKLEAEGGRRLTEVVSLDAEEQATGWPWRRGGGTPVPRTVDLDPAHDVVALPYSSGTTGTPKGVMLTHRNLVANLCQFSGPDATGPSDVVVAVLPFFHVYGLIVVLHLALLRSATVVTLPRFDLHGYLAAVARHRATRLHIAPPIAANLVQSAAVDEFDLSSVRIVMSGAAPLAPPLTAELASRLGCIVKQGYGMTELSPGAHLQPDDVALIRPGSVGPPQPNTSTRIIDVGTLDDLPPGQPGEVWIRGPQVMKGYLHRDDATRETVMPGGWLRTGDVGRIDDDGNLYIVDRLKELIKYKGFQVPPAELEALLLGHPAVADVAVVPRPDAEAGEVPKAYVVPSPGAGVTVAELIDFVATHVTYYKRVRLIEFVDSIPRAPSGKILRRLLVERERKIGPER